MDGNDDFDDILIVGVTSYRYLHYPFSSRRFSVDGWRCGTFLDFVGSPFAAYVSLSSEPIRHG